MNTNPPLGSPGNGNKEGNQPEAGHGHVRPHVSRGWVRWKAVLLSGVGCVGVGAVLIACSSHQMVREQPAGTVGAEFVGSESCGMCHDDVMSEFRFTSHGQMRDPKGESCEACHGPGSLHVQEGEGFIAMPNDANCLSCHSGAHAHRLMHTDKKGMMDWSFSHHRNAGVGCTECHNPHSHTPMGLRIRPEFQVQQIDSTSALCLSCHQDIMGRISMPYHHPIREGAMGCTSCHDPHSNMERRLLAKNETCYKCHQAQQGFLIT
jgi:DmsE family decaheme c-type cytochrome